MKTPTHITLATFLKRNPHFEVIRENLRLTLRALSKSGAISTTRQGNGYPYRYHAEALLDVATNLKNKLSAPAEEPAPPATATTTTTEEQAMAAPHYAYAVFGDKIYVYTLSGNRLHMHAKFAQEPDADRYCRLMNTTPNTLTT